MASRSRSRSRKNSHTPGNTRIDAALDAMRPYGFDKKLVRETVNELLDVYDGAQGWPFIEEASYKLLIESILSKQQISSEEKDNIEIREGQTVTLVAPPTCADSEAGSSNLVAQESLLVSPQTDDAPVSASLDGEDSNKIRVEAENKRMSVGNSIGSNNNRNVDAKKKVRFPEIQSSQPRDRVPIIKRHNKQCYGWVNGAEEEEEKEDEDSNEFRLDAANKRMSVDDAAIGSNNSRNVDAKKQQVRLPVIESSQQRHDNVAIKRPKPCYGWIDSDTDGENDLIHFPVPPLSEEQLKVLQQNGAPKSGSRRRRRKSRWDEKPDGVM